MALFDGSVIAITGAASGIGLATAHLLASRNAKLSIADINASALEQAEKDLKEKFPDLHVHRYVLDVSKEDEVQSWIENITHVYGRLDGAANLAGIIGPSIGLKGLEQLPFSEWSLILSVNLTGVMLCLKHQLRHIAPNSSIVNASSIAGLQGMRNNAAYSASKHGVIGLTRSAAKEVGDRGIRVNAVCPGFIDTPMSKRSGEILVEQDGRGEEERQKKIRSVALGRKGEAQEVAEVVVWLLGKGSGFVTGSAVSVDGGWNC